MNTISPLLYTFRRCPYAIRARTALLAKGIQYDSREVDLKNKPADLLARSPKGTVPVLVLPTGDVIDESLDILDYVLDYKLHKPTESLINDLQTSFIPHLSRYKYQDRYDDVDPEHERKQLLTYLNQLDSLLSQSEYLFGYEMTKADIAVLPFVRQLYLVDEAYFDSLHCASVQRWLHDFLKSDLHQLVMEKQSV